MTVCVEPEVIANGKYGEVGRALKPLPVPLPHRMLWTLWPMVVITLVALAVRLFRLDGQSMWSDEGLSLYRAQQSLTGILSNIIMVGDFPTRDTSPPFYFVLLAAMRALAGETTFALRYTSAALGVLSVPLIYAIGRKLFDPRVGLVAALLLALSPIHVYYSQELRNYSLLLTLNLLSVWLVWGILNAATVWRRLAWGAGWLFVAALMVYTHYFALFVLAFEGLALVIGLLRRRAARVAVGVLALAALIAAPLIPFGLSRLRAGPQFHFTEMPPLDVIQHGLTSYGYGMLKVVALPWPWLLPWLALALLGVTLWWLRPAYRAAVLFVVAYLAIPLTLFLAVSQISPIYNGPRHLLFGLPPFLLLVACALAGLRGRLAWALLPMLALVVAQQVTRLRDQTFDLEVMRDDVRSAAVYLGQHVAPQDVVVLHDALLGFTFDHYYTGAAPVVSVPRYATDNEATAKAELTQLAQTHDRVWFLSDPRPRDGFPRNLLPRWLDDTWLGQFEASFRVLFLPLSVTVYRATLPTVAALPPDATTVNQRWAPGVTLRGYQGATTLGLDKPLQLALYWSAAQPLAPDPRLELALVDSEGRTWWQGSRPFYPKQPMAQWPSGEIVVQNLDLDLPPGLAPTEYTLRWRLAQSPGGRVIAPQAGGDTDGWLNGPRVRFTRPAEAIDLPDATTRTATSAHFCGLDLEAYDEPRDALHPGGLWSGALFWRARRPVDFDAQVQARLVDDQGQTVAETTVAPAPADVPTSKWQPGDLIRTPITLAIPPRLPKELRLVVGLVDASGQAVRGWAGWLPIPQAELALDTVAVEDWPLETTVPAYTTPVEAQIGPARLRGYSLTPSDTHPGDKLTVSLAWQVTEPTDTSYKVFVHLLDAAGKPRAQIDAFPVNGTRVTSGWRAGETLKDDYQLALPADLAPGAYRLAVGLYRPDDGVRAPATRDGQPVANDVVELGTVQVTR